MSQKFGNFDKSFGSYTINKLPRVGYYDYIYRNDHLLVKLDQFGIKTCQMDPTGGITLFKRENREVGSPCCVYFDVGKGIHNNFDVFCADKLEINFTPTKATYCLTFGKLQVVTSLYICADDTRFVMSTDFVNNGNETNLQVMPCGFPFVNDMLMAPWDKPEWYTKTELLHSQHDAFVATHFSVAGNVEERRYLSCVSNCEYDDIELSAERLVDATNNFATIPNKLGDNKNPVYAFEQCFAGVKQVSLGKGQTFNLTQVFAVADKQSNLSQTVEDSVAYFDNDTANAELTKLQNKYDKLFSVKTVDTPDRDFNSFVNGFLPLELSWVSVLDRGWPTGMRGVRDAANDYHGYIDYDQNACRSVIANIFSKQRSDGWYPRQVPFGDSTKFDLRHFVDSACFFTEFVYDYICKTDDYSVLQQDFGYYDSDIAENGLTHLTKGVEYLMNPDSLGEHGLVKMQGGDWLDCLNGAGINGKGESVMVSCQLIMSIRNLVEILTKVNGSADDKYLAFAEQMANSINKASYNERGYYNAVFTDNGDWLFSTEDADGFARVYAPTNAYAIISGVADGKQDQVWNNIATLRTRYGYKLFDKPLGETPISGIGKMGSGDFQPYFAENGSVYNHGSQCFVIRALASMGRHDLICDVLKCALPLYQDVHPSDKACSAPYAMTNCYHLIPSFEGRSMFSFLTGSVAMVERAIYDWIFGVRFTVDSLELHPCVPEQYANSTIKFAYKTSKITIKYNGFGNKADNATVNGKPLDVTNGVAIDKSLLANDVVIEITLK